MKARSLSKEPLGRVSGFEYESTLETAVDNDAESDVSELVAGKEEQPAGDSSATVEERPTGGSVEPEEEKALDYEMQLTAVAAPMVKRIADDDSIRKRRSTSAMTERHEQMLNDRRRSFAQFGTLQFSVVKINQRGRRQERQLRLSDVGVENVRRQSGGEEVVSSIFEYASVTKVVLNSTTRFSLFYMNGKHPYVYSSPVAIHILAEITARVNAIRARGQQMAETLRPTLASGRERAAVSRVRALEENSDVVNLKPQERIVVAVWAALNGAKSDEHRALQRFLAEREKAKEPPAELARTLRLFLDGFRFHLLQSRARELEEAAGSLSSPQDDMLLRETLEVTLETAILPAFLPPLVKHFAAQCKESDARFCAALPVLRRLSQADLHIPEAYRHDGGFADAQESLRALQHDQLPCEILDALLRTVRAIYKTANKLGAQAVMAGDDLLPVLIYVVIHSDGLANPFSKCMLAWELCDPEQLQSEAGYYLTVFESGLQWIISQEEFK